MGLWRRVEDVGAPAAVARLDQTRALRGPWVVAEPGTHGCGLWGRATTWLEGAAAPLSAPSLTPVLATVATPQPAVVAVAAGVADGAATVDGWRGMTPAQVGIA
ncbi:hypothetical protein GUJ93_ZPchr0009g1967 [Zizania palustris]|uniref:Uncharacterized protein n=1 Tax=Zizania palustris TaxID=103762 RepID=A0A8J5RN24_ZIZPA|nr:hypothetical protein GUJ93_ZPchr0009g1967 [Zizania palustris]